MPQAQIDFDINEGLSSVLALGDQLRQLDQARAGDRCLIDLSSCGHLSPDGVSVLGVIVLDLKHAGVVVDCLPPIRDQVRQYWISSGMEQLVQSGVCKSEILHSGEVAPLQQHTKAAFSDSDQVVCMVRRFIELSADHEEYLRICVNEVIQNVQDHSESAVGCVMTALYKEGCGEIRVAIVDRGVGICNSLKKRFPDTTAVIALERVTKGRYSAMSRSNNMGLGISNVCGIVNELGGDMLILSGNASAEKRTDRPWNIVESLKSFAGTGVFFTLRVGS